MSNNTCNEEQDEQPFILPGNIYLKNELYGSDILTSRWHRNALEDFATCAGDETFPCLFCRKAWKDGTIHFAFVECGPVREYHDLLLSLNDYTNMVRRVDINNLQLAPLVVFFEASLLERTSLHALGWQVLNWVHQMDPAPWPEFVPMSPDDPGWCFCFNGVQLFINMSTPEHQTLRSRNLGRFLTFVINPRENFDAVASVHTRSGRLVREKIRDRMAAYNDSPVPIELGFYGEADNREWLQYQLEEPRLERTAECPFKPRQSRTPSGTQHKLPAA